MPTDNELHQTYPDVLSGVDTDLLRLVRDLHAVGQASRDLAPGDAAIGFENRVSNDSPRPGPVPTSRVRMRPIPTVATLPAVLMLMALIASGAALAINNITNLGRTTNDVPHLTGHLSYFRHTGPFLRQGGKPELLFIGTMVDDGSAIERWPLVKALRQFGTLSNAAAADTRSCGIERGKPTCVGPGRPLGVPQGPPTYNLAHARYTSRYLTFVDLDVLNYGLHMASHLSPTEMRLLRKYIGHEHSALAWLTLAAGQPAESSTREFPLVSIGGYVETRYAAAYPYDLQTATGAPANFLGTWEFFQAIQQSLLHHHLTNAGTTDRGVRMGLPPATLLPDVNAEANVITALICHADHMQPKKVCGRAVIRKIVKHVR